MARPLTVLKNSGPFSICLLQPHPETYDIRVDVIDHVRRVDEQLHKLRVREVGFIWFVHVLATERRLTYGVMAVVIALLTGALMGLLFKGGGSH